MLQLIMLFASLLFLSSLFINGWYNITRGQWVIDHTGKREWKGKIFSFWGKMLQSHTSTFEFYTGNEFLKQFEKIRDFFQNPNSELLDFGVNAVLVRKMPQQKFNALLGYGFKKGVLINVEEGRDDDKGGKTMMITIFKEVDHYTIPNILRAPLGECLACMSSVYGTLLFLFWYKVVLQNNSVFSQLAGAEKLGLWVIFCISLAYLNEFIFSVNHKLQQR